MIHTLKDTDPFQEKDFRNRIHRLGERLREQSIDGALILQNTDLYYFAGTVQQSYLYIPSEGEPLLMVRKDFNRAKAESTIRLIEPVESPKEIPTLLKRKGYKMPRTLGYEGDVLPANLYFYYKNLFAGTELRDISHDIRLIRAAKSPGEIECIQTAAGLADKVLDNVKDFIGEGISEIEFSGKVEAFMRKLGHQGIVRMRMWGGEMFYGHLMAGSTAAVSSYMASPTGGEGISPAVAQGPGFRKIRAREPVLVDFIFTHNGYLSDQTRIFAIKSLSESLMSAHETMIEVQEKLKKEAKPGRKAGDLYTLALEHVDNRGYSDYFMGADPKRVAFVGHGIGLEVDEYPFLAKGQDLILEEGMIIALEPKLIFPGKGVVGIENTHVVTAQGLKQLNRFPDEVVII